MRNAISSLCCFVVGVQVLIGVPLLVCVAYFFLAGNGNLGPLAVEVHAGRDSAPHLVVHGATIPPPPTRLAISPPPNMIPAMHGPSHDNPILAARTEHGSPLAGTVFSESAAPSDEQNLFVAAVEKVAAETTASAPNASPKCVPASNVDPTSLSQRQQADRFAIQQLYAMAEVDEQVGEYERADQWRALAREVRGKPGFSESVSPSSDTTLSALPSGTADLPH